MKLTLEEIITGIEKVIEKLKLEKPETEKDKAMINGCIANNESSLKVLKKQRENGLKYIKCL